tara:strand:+ start:423 stop:644 length:222 start_codon:yes stop_codon:yes gene_type:complete
MSLEQYKDANRKELWEILQIQSESFRRLEAEQLRLVTFVNCHIVKWESCRELKPSIQVLKRGLPKFMPIIGPT